MNARLADAFHAAGLPVVWVHATGLPAGRVGHPIPEPEELPADFADVDERLPEQPEDLHVHKDRTISAFIRSDLAARLRERGVTQVVVTGIATGMGVESTARNAYDEGFHVLTVPEALLDGSAERQEAALVHDFPSFGLVTTADELLAALASR